MDGSGAVTAGAAFALAFALSLAVTLVTERVMKRLGVVARPRADRWHREPVPLLGGVAIVLATIVPSLLIAGRAWNIVALVALAGAMAVVGLVDDLAHLSPPQKLLAELLLASALLYLGFGLRSTGIELI